jgi:hypothetical protein
MPCAASPGWYCTPLYNRQTVCPANWYCLGGEEPARRCAEGTWSAVGSKYPEECVAHFSTDMCVFILVFVAIVCLIIFVLCMNLDFNGSRAPSARRDVQFVVVATSDPCRKSLVPCAVPVGPSGVEEYV